MIRGRSAVVLACVGLLAIASCVACGSLDKSEMTTRLLELPKNADAKALGLTRDSLTWTSATGEARVEEIVFLHAKAIDPRAGLPPVLLIHGTPATLFTWTRVIFGTPESEGLRQHRDVYALEVIGHGMAPSSNRPRSFEDCGDFVAAFAARIGTPQVDLVGHSYGGEFCLDVAIDRPDLVRRLVVIDSSGIGRAPEEFLPEEVAMREMSLAPIGWLLNSRSRITTALAPHFVPGPTTDQVEEVFLTCDNSTNWKTMVDLARDENGDRESEMSRIQAETLLVFGDRDIAYPPAKFATRFAELIPGAKSVIVKDCGHYPQEERPAALLAELGTFLNR